MKKIQYVQITFMMLKITKFMKILSIIPARGGSKGIKLKNLIKLNNIPLITYTIKASINSKKISISPISAFRPRRWKGKIVPDKSKIIIKNLNPQKRPISAVADNVEVRNVKLISIKINKKIKFNLLYDLTRSLQKKIKLEQIRNEVR